MPVRSTPTDTNRKGLTQAAYALARSSAAMSAGTPAAVAPAHPVAPMHTSGHCLWVNGAALRAANVTAATEVPSGGAIDRDADGEPAGILRDAAMQLVERAVPALSGETVHVPILFVASMLATLLVSGLLWIWLATRLAVSYSIVRDLQGE